jgi:hypothetical protein
MLIADGDVRILAIRDLVAHLHLHYVHPWRNVDQLGPARLTLLSAGLDAINQ